MSRGKKPLKLVGQVFNRLTVIRHISGPKWECQCSCGNLTIVRAESLKKGLTKSCGCWHKEASKLQMAKVNSNSKRAGPRKCKRCKQVFNREPGEVFVICFSCRTHCKRCNTELTSDTLHPSAKPNKYECKACVNERVKLTTNKERARDYDLVRNYGITSIEYDAILSSQGGVCFICKSPPKSKRLAVDHKHQKKENRRSSFEKREFVRGILCWPCNSAIEKFRDNPELLRQAAIYLETWPAQHILSKVNKQREEYEKK